jgi:hypothetical protein
MAVNLGGRGKKAPYEVTHIRLPVPIKETVQAWVDDWKARHQNLVESKPKASVWTDDDSNETYPIIEEILSVQDRKLEAIQKVVNEYAGKSTHTERWKITDKLVNAINEILKGELQNE